MTTTEDTRVVTAGIDDIGPIQHADIPLMPHGGICVYRGANESGKSTLLSGIDELAHGAGNSKLEPRRGAVAGRAVGFGFQLTVTPTRTTRKRLPGLAVSEIEGDLDIGRLIDPGKKDPEAADRERIRTACKLARVKPDVDAFAQLVGGMDVLREHVSSEALAQPDIVEMARMIRADLNKAALAVSSSAEKAEGTAAGLRKDAELAQQEVETDPARLNAAVETAIEARQRIRSAIDAASLARDRAQQATADLQRAQSTYAGPTVAEAEALAKQSTTAREAAGVRVDAARAALDAAERESAAAAAREREAHRAFTAARQHEADVEAARAALAAAAGPVEAPTADELVLAEHVLADAQAARDNAVLVRKARADLTQAEQVADEARGLRARSQNLREAAKSTDDVLARALAGVAPKDWRIVDGRIVVVQAAGEFFFHNLSAGARGKQGVDLVLDAIGPREPGAEPVAMTIPQQVFEGFDRNAEQELLAHALQREVSIYTAAADKDEVGPLRADVLQPAGAMQ